MAPTSVLIQHKVAVYCYWLLGPVLQNAFCQQNVSELGILKPGCCSRLDFLELPCSRTTAAVPSSNWKCCTGRRTMWRSDLPEILRILCFFVFSPHQHSKYVLSLLWCLSKATPLAFSVLFCTLHMEKIILNASGLHVKGKNGFVCRTWHCCKRSNQNLCSVMHWGFSNSFERS